MTNINGSQIFKAEMSAVSISVIICTFNGKSRGYLDLAIDSVYHQSSAADEVILVDDGSTDGTAEFVKDRYPGVIVARQTNSGLPSARNAGIRLAKGEFIAFLDDDDLWHLNKLEVQRRQVRASLRPIDFIYASRMRLIDSRGTLGRSVSADIVYGWWPACLIGNPITGPSGVLVARGVFDRVGLFDETLKIGEDYEFWIRCIRAGMMIVYSREELLLYRVHEAQSTAPRNIRSAIAEVDSMVARYLGSLSVSERLVVSRIRAVRDASALCTYERTSYIHFLWTGILTGKFWFLIILFFFFLARMEGFAGMSGRMTKKFLFKLMSRPI